MSHTLTHRELAARTTHQRGPSTGSTATASPEAASADAEEVPAALVGIPAVPGTGGVAATEPEVQDREAGMATAEYAIATVAAAGFAGLLVVILRSAEVRELLLGIIRSALSV